MIIADVTFIQKQLLETVQGDSNPLELSPYKYLIPSVGHQTLSIFTRFLVGSSNLLNIFKKIIQITKKMRQAHKIDDFASSLPDYEFPLFWAKYLQKTWMSGYFN